MSDACWVWFMYHVGGEGDFIAQFWCDERPKLGRVYPVRYQMRAKLAGFEGPDKKPTFGPQFTPIAWTDPLMKPPMGKNCEIKLDAGCWIWEPGDLIAKIAESVVLGKPAPPAPLQVATEAEAKETVNQIESQRRFNEAAAKLVVTP